MVLLAAFLFGGALDSTPTFRRTWSFAPGDQIGQVIREQGKLWVGIDSGVVCLDEASGSVVKKFELIPKAIGAKFVIAKDVVYIQIRCPYEVKGEGIYAVSRSSGKKLWYRPAHGNNSIPIYSNGSLFYQDSPGTLLCLDTKTSQVKWKRSLATNVSSSPNVRQEFGMDQQFRLKTSVVRGNRIIFNDDSRIQCWDATTGMKQYSIASKYVDEVPLVVGETLLAVNDFIEGYDEKTGKRKWRFPRQKSGPSFVAAIKDTFIVNVDSNLICIKASDGSKRWEFKLPDLEEHSRNNDATWAQSEIIVQDQGLHAVSLSGKKLWSAPLLDNFGVVSYSPRQLIVRDFDTIRAYTSAPSKLSPADEAAAICIKPLEIDEADFARLRQIGAPAFPAVLKALMSIAKNEGGWGMSQADNAWGLVGVLGEHMTPSNTADFIKALNSLPDASIVKRISVDALAQSEDDSAAVGVLESYTLSSQAELAGSALEVLISCELKDSDRALLRLIPKLSKYRQVLVSGACKFGNPEALGLALGDRNLSGRIETPSNRAADFSFKVLGEYKAASGTTYQLGNCRLLGSALDLWIRQMDRPTTMVFTGAGGKELEPPKRTFPDENWRTEREKAEAEYQRITQMGWHSFADNIEQFRADSDGDGLTNVEEVRLLTNPSNPDSDGDGLKDGNDAMPNAPLRKLTDAEKVIGLAVSFAMDTEPTQVFEIFEGPQRMLPFQFPISNGPLLWQRGEKKLHPIFSSSFELEILRVIDKIGNRAKDDLTKPWEDQFIEWDATRTTARVGVRGGYYGITVVLKKFGNEWFVVRSIHRWIS